jgi:hypothetical protein
LASLEHWHEALGRGRGEVGQSFAGRLQRRLGGVGGGYQLTIEPSPVVFAAAVLDRSRALFGQAPARSRHCSAGAPGNAAACRKSRVMTRTASGIPQQRAVARRDSVHAICPNLASTLCTALATPHDKHSSAVERPAQVA